MTACKEFVPRLYAASLRPQVRLVKHTPQYTSNGSVLSPQDNLEFNNAEFQELTYYINNTHAPISVLRRDGLRLVIAHRPHAKKKGVTVFRHLRARGVTLAHLLEDSSNLRHVNSVELEAIREQLLTLDTRREKEVEIVLEYFIPSEDLQQIGDTLYHYQSDTVISWRARHQLDDHPYSAEFEKLAGFGQVSHFGDMPELNIRLRYVNHAKDAPDLYIRFMGRVLTIKPQRDMPVGTMKMRDNKGQLKAMRAENYVQLVFPSKADEAHTHPQSVVAIRYDLKEARALGLFDNKHDASVDGALEWQHKRDVQTLNHEMETLKAASARDKAVLEQQNLEHEREIQRLKNDTALLSQELEKMRIDAKREQHHQDVLFARMENRRREVEAMAKIVGMLDTQTSERAENSRKDREREDQRAKAATERQERELQALREQQREGLAWSIKWVGLVFGMVMPVLTVLSKSPQRG